MGLVPDGATCGSYDWTDELPPFELKQDVVPGKTQNPRLTIDHTAHVYFADYDRPFAYFVIDYMRVAASPGEIMINNETARGFFNSSAHIAYKSVTASDNCRVTKTIDAPLALHDNFSFVFQGTEMILNAATGGGTGRRIFKPEAQTGQNYVTGWSLVRSGSKSGWIAHQRDVWNALVQVARKDWLDALYKNGSPFGAIKEMPGASYQTVGFELFTMWKIERTSSGQPFTIDQRKVELTLQMDYSHHLNFFNNAMIPPKYDAKRLFHVWEPALVPKVLKLHEIARAP